MWQGRDLEEYVAQRFTEATGLKVRRANAIYQSEEHPLLLADFDRLIVGQKAGLECKTVSPFSADKWADGKIPAHYLAQVDHYLAVSGFDCWYVAALIFGKELVIHEIIRDKAVLNGANKAMKAVPYTYTTPKWEYNPQTRRREKIGMEERTVEAASMFDVNKAIMRCLVKNLAMFGLGLYVYAGEDLPEDAALQPESEPQKQPRPKSTSQKPEQPPVPCICAWCNQPIKRDKLKDGSIMQAAEFAATHEGMCTDCYKATRLNVA